MHVGFGRFELVIMHNPLMNVSTFWFRLIFDSKQDLTTRYHKTLSTPKVKQQLPEDWYNRKQIFGFLGKTCIYKIIYQQSI